jgi:DNA gyrase/topoisomerase IV subunit A
MQNQYNTRIPGSVDNYGNTGEWDDDWHAIARYQLYWKEKLMPEIKRKINNE